MMEDEIKIRIDRETKAKFQMATNGRMSEVLRDFIKRYIENDPELLRQELEELKRREKEIEERLRQHHKAKEEALDYAYNKFFVPRIGGTITAFRIYFTQKEVEQEILQLTGMYPHTFLQYCLDRYKAENGHEYPEVVNNVG